MSKQYPGGLITKTPVTPSGPYETSTASGIWTLDQQAYWRKLNQWPIAGSVEPDPQFNYVTMLLHGDGTNGAQNNTFLDSSTNNFTITRNGNTTQGSFSPYGSNWSNAFTASSGSYLSVPYSSAFNLTGDFTVECWINPSQLPTANGTGSPLYPRIFSFGTYDAANSIGLEINSNDVAIVNALVVWYNGSQYYSANNIVAVGNWYHCAMVRSGTTIKIYLNGTSVITITGASAAVNTSQALFIASLQSFTADANACFKGYISNLRVVKGTAVYTNTFTPPTTPLTAITNTVLLTCQSNRYIDNSTTAATITSFGTPSVQRFNPFGTSTAYSTSVIGGSGYFDGSGDYLTAPDDAGFSLGSNNFTIESWVYPTASPAQPMIIGQWTSSYAWTMQLSNDGNRYLRALLHDGSFQDYVSSTSLQLNAWNHCAFVRESNTVSLYLNGARVYTTTFSGTVTNSTSAVSVGADASGGQPLQGYITNSRVVNGTALYSGTTYTVPTAPLTAVTNTSILLNTVNAGIFDNAMMNDLETVGNAQISTSVKKFGTGSIAFDGTGDNLVSNTASSDLYAFGTGNFTIEFWLYLNSTSAVQVFYDGRPASAQGLQPTIYINSSGTLFYYTNVANRITGSSLSANIWYHIAVARSGTSTKMFVDGTQVGSTYTDSNNYVNPALRPMIGADGFNSGIPGGNPMNGYIDDLRVTKGYARYTANFTPPTAAFPNIGPT